MPTTMPTRSTTRPSGPGAAGQANQPDTEAAPAGPVDVAARYGLGDLRGPGRIDQLGQRLIVDGLVVFSGIDGPQRLLEVADAVMHVVAHPDSDARRLTTLTDLGPAGDLPNAAGFSRRELLPHTDRSGIPDPPALLMTTCAAPSVTGGTCLLVDGEAVHDDLSRTAPAAWTLCCGLDRCSSEDPLAISGPSSPTHRPRPRARQGRRRAVASAA